MKRLLLIALLAGCNGNFATDSTSSTSQDNSDSHEQTGISSCSQGTTFVCDGDNAGNCTQSEQCNNVNGEPVILNGPDPINCDFSNECLPPPEPVEPVV